MNKELQAFSDQLAPLLRNYDQAAATMFRCLQDIFQQFKDTNTEFKIYDTTTEKLYWVETILTVDTTSMTVLLKNQDKLPTRFSFDKFCIFPTYMNSSGYTFNYTR